MIENYCHACKETHNWHSWRGVGTPTQWICSKHFNDTPREYIPERIKQERKQYARDLLQPRREGEPSREFIEAYPKQSQSIFTEAERRKARKVWTDL